MTDLWYSQTSLFPLERYMLCSPSSSSRVFSILLGKTVEPSLAWDANWNLSVLHVNPLAELSTVLVSCVVEGIYKKDQMRLGRTCTSYGDNNPFYVLPWSAIQKVISPFWHSKSVQIKSTWGKWTWLFFLQITLRAEKVLVTMPWVVRHHNNLTDIFLSSLCGSSSLLLIYIFNTISTEIKDTCFWTNYKHLINTKAYA